MLTLSVSGYADGACSLGGGFKASRAWSWTYTSISLTVRPTLLKEMTLANLRLTIRDLPTAVASPFADCTQHCPSRTGIPQSVCTMSTNASDARAHKSTFRWCPYIQHLAKQDTSSWNPQWHAMRHECTISFLKQNGLECVVRKHANSRTSDNFKVYPSARKVAEIYSGMWKKSSTLQSLVPTPESDTLRRLCGAFRTERPTLTMTCYTAARHCNPTLGHPRHWAWPWIVHTIIRLSQ